MSEVILATGKDVVVIGGGDTGSDCVGTSIRQGAKSVTQLEIMPRPPERENKALTWPFWPMKLRTSTSHEEGCSRDWSVATRRALGNGCVEALELVRIEWNTGEGGGGQLKEIEDSVFSIPADLVLLAMGFVHPVHDALIRETGVELDQRGNVKADPEADPAAIGRTSTRCLQPAICAVASRSWSGRFARGGSAPAPSISS